MASSVRRLNKRAHRVNRVSWSTWFLGGVTAFVLFRLLAWRLFQMSPPTSMLPVQLAQALPWIVLGAACLFALRAVLDARRRRRWVAKQRSIEAVRRMSWTDFERAVGEAFVAEGYAVDLVGQGGADGGVDLVLRKGGEMLLVQCKHWQSNRVGVAIAREMLGLAVHYAATGVVIVCTGGFTREANSFVLGKPIRLIDGEALVTMLGKGM